MIVIRRRGNLRPLHVNQGDASHDQIAAVGHATWMSGIDPIGETPPPVAQELLPPPAPEQHNDHVMTYWNWRLDRLDRRSGR